MPSAIIGGGLALGSAFLSNKGAKDAQNAQQNAINASQTQLGNVVGNTPLGVTATANQGDPLRLGFGLLQPSATGLSQFANQQTAGLGQAGQIPPELLQAIQQAQGIQGPGIDPTLNALQGTSLAQFGGANNFLNQRVGQAAAGPEEVRARELGLLREQARPFEERAFQDLQENQFATGRGGTSGGGLQTEAFARGLAQADTGRQLAATQVGQSQQALQDQLLQSAFGRFAGLGQLTGDIGQSRFGQELGRGSFQQGLAQQNIGNQFQLAGLPAALQQGQLGNIAAALQGQAGVQGQGLDLFNADLQRQIAAANARIGSGSNIASIVGSRNFNPGAQSDLLGGLLGGAGTRIATGEGGGVVGDILGGIFG